MYLDLFASTFIEDRGSQEYDDLAKHFQKFDHNLDKDYCEFLGDPIYDTSREGSADFEALGQHNIIEANPKTSIVNFQQCSHVNDS